MALVSVRVALKIDDTPLKVFDFLRSLRVSGFLVLTLARATLRPALDRRRAVLFNNHELYGDGVHR